MSMRRVCVLAGVAAVGFTVAGAGSAAAAVPFTDPRYGLYFGLILNHDETVALSNSSLPEDWDDEYRAGARVAILDSSVAESDEDAPPPQLTIPESSLPEVVDGAAAAPNGMFGFTVVNPMLNEGRLVRVIALVE
ncbi:hypothetical protein AB0H76_26730 [Nocardia sp. NPDC050712]|uniref:hypothetical protein n=1 Tax=Nocardia sp. NPDC050712 TaxID=3155518 RepID=UPI003410E86C